MRHSFKYLSDIDPISTSYVVFDDSPPILTPAEPLSDHLDDLDPIIDPAEDCQYASVHLSRAPANAKFAYLHIGNNFIEKSANLSHCIHDIARVTSPSSPPTICRQLYDISSSLTPPDDRSLFEYEPIQQYFADPNYINNNNNNNNNALPICPTRKLCQINILKAKRHSNSSQLPCRLHRH